MEIDVYTAARIGSYLSFQDLMAWENVYRDCLVENPFGWNPESRGAAIQWGHPCIYTKGFYSVLKPSSLIRLMKKGLERGKCVEPMLEAEAMRNHLAAEGHQRNGDRSWTLVLTALRYQRWTTVPKLIDEVLWSPRYFEEAPSVAPHVGLHALKARTFTPTTPSPIKMHMALVLNQTVDISTDEDTLVQVLSARPCLAWGKTVIKAVAELPDARIGVTPVSTTVKIVSPQTCTCQIEQSSNFETRVNNIFQGYSLHQRLAIVDSFLSGGRVRIRVDAKAALWMWRTIVDFLDDGAATQRLPTILTLLDLVISDSTGVPFSALAPFLPPVFFKGKSLRYLQMPYYLKASLTEYYSQMHSKAVPLYWRPEWSREAIGKQAARILQRIVQVKRHKPLYFFKVSTMPLGLWAEMVCVTTPPPLPHFAVGWTGVFKVSSLADDHPRVELRFESKPLWDFSSGLETMALGCDSSGHWSLQARKPTIPWLTIQM